MGSETKFKETEIGKIPEDWKEGKIGDHIELIYGNGLPERERKKGNVPVFGSNGIIGFHDRAIVKGPGVIIGRKGSVGEITFSKSDFWPIDTTYYVKIIDNDDIVFWYYFLDTLKLNQMNSHSAVPGLNRDNVYEIIRSIPGIEEQQAIASILGALDDKIEINRQMNATLERIGQAIFKRWFVDFEFPNEAGKPYKSSRGEMVDSALGEIPKGWRVGRFGELAKIQPGFAFKSSDFNLHGYKIIKIANIQNGIVDTTQSDHVSEKVFQSVDRKFYLISGDVVIAMTGAEIGKIGIVPKVDETMLLNQRVGKSVSDYYLWAYFMLKGVEIQALIQGISSASSAQPNISNSDIERTDVVIPDTDVLKHFSRLGNGIYSMLVSNLAENQTLSQLRDSLLPKLMSGKIRVKDAEKFVEENTR